MPAAPGGFAKDVRRVPGAYHADLHATVMEELRPLRERQVRVARALAEIQETGSFAFVGASSAVEVARRVGFDLPEARDLLSVGHAVRFDPRYAEDLFAGRVSLARVALVGRIHASPALHREGDDFRDRLVRDPAGAGSVRALRSLLRERHAEAGFAELGLRHVEMFVPERTYDGFQRCRALASRKEKKPLDESQTLSRLVDHYRESFDPDLVRPGARRLPPTEERPGDRTIPAEVRRAIRARSGDRCEVYGCPNELFLQLCHLQPHALGSGREAEDLVQACDTHHTELDKGLLRFVGWTVERHPIFENLQGERFFRPPSGRCGPPGASTGPPDGASAVRERAPPFLAGLAVLPVRGPDRRASAPTGRSGPGRGPPAGRSRGRARTRGRR